MDKISTLASFFPELTRTDDDGVRSRFIENKKDSSEPGKSRRGWNMLQARDRLFGILNETAQVKDGAEKTGALQKDREVPRQRGVTVKADDLHSLKMKSEVIIDLGNLEYNTKQKEDSLQSCAHYKIGLTKILHNYDTLYSKYYRDLMNDVQVMNKSSNLAYSSPKQLMDSVRGVMNSMKSMVSMLQPMAQVMLRMNEINMNILKIGHEIGPEGSNKVFKELSEKVQSYPDIPTESLPQVGMTSDRPYDELMVGKYYQDWSTECMRQGLDTLRYATDTMEKHTQKLKDLAAMSKISNAIKVRKKEDDKTFHLPSGFANKAEEGEQSQKKIYDEVESGISFFREAVSMEIPEMMNDELLKDPYLLSSEVISQAALGKEITGIDDSSNIQMQTHASMF
ncbi:MAG: hypothetical protein AB9903_23775 [Vulcanimicrobiota bacterium]